MTGRDHEALNLALLSPILLMGDRLADPMVLSGVGGYLIGTFLLTPDLDLSGRTRVQPLRRWGILAWIWFPYGLLSRHRGVSHTFILGPTVRLAYLLAVVCLAGLLLGVEFEVSLSPVLIATFAAGYYASQWAHLLADGLLFRRRRRAIRKIGRR